MARTAGKVGQPRRYPRGSDRISVQLSPADRRYVDFMRSFVGEAIGGEPISYSELFHFLILSAPDRCPRCGDIGAVPTPTQGELP